MTNLITRSDDERLNIPPLTEDIFVLRDSLRAALSERDAALEAKEKAETGSFRVDAGIERFLQRWDFLVKGRGRQASIMIDALEDVVATLRTQRRG